MNTKLSATTRPSASTSLQVGSVTLNLGDNARVTVEVRAPTKAAAVARASELAQKFFTGSGVSSLVPAQVKVGLRLARGLARAAGAGRLRSLWRRLPSGVRSRASKLARELAS